MRGQDIVKIIMEQSEITNAELASRLGISSPALWDRLNNKKVKDMSVTTLSDMLRQLDYKIVVMPRAAHVPKDSCKKQVKAYIWQLISSTFQQSKTSTFITAYITPEEATPLGFVLCKGQFLV